ncbi:MAG: glycosyltransferase family 39 protein, partial [Candidatus Omnitrophica bacterium]|nr:glycosyltransferase family 39 protein [Candidatus Omnitrophota bacterium]
MTRQSPCRWALVGVFLLAVAVRFYHINVPYVETYNSIGRQSIVASVARNFYQRSMNFFYPQVDENGKGPYLYNAEMPIYSYLMALAYHVVGGPVEGAARTVNVLFSLGTLLFLMLLAKDLYGPRGQLAALMFAAFSPLNVAISRSIQPESLMVCAFTGAVYLYHRHLRSGRPAPYVASLLLMFVAVATKFINLYMCLPVMYLVWRRRGREVYKDRALWVYLLISMTALIWYVAMWVQGQTQDLVYSPYTYVAERGGEGMSFVRTLLHWPFLRSTLKILLFHVLTPAGAVFFVLGMLPQKIRREDGVVWVWLFATVLFYLLMWRTLIQHPYY